jgi:hypothetical protein
MITWQAMLALHQCRLPSANLMCDLWQAANDRSMALGWNIGGAEQFSISGGS